MSKPFTSTDGASFIRQLNLRVARLERVGVLTGAASFLKVVQSNALATALPVGAEHVYVLPVDPAETEAVVVGDVWKDTSYPTPVIRTWDGDMWVKSESAALVDAMEKQASSINVYLDQPDPGAGHRPTGSLWRDPATGTLMRWVGEEWVATPLPGSGELEIIRDNIDAAMDAANGKNKITYTNVAEVDAPGPPPADDPTRTVGDVHRNRNEDTFVIYASWQWDGNDWNPTTFGDEVLDSLDVGKLTAGAAEIDIGVINKFWADEAFINQGYAKILTVASVTPDMLTSTDELSVNPTWSRAELRDVPPYDLGNGMSFTTTVAQQYKGGTHALYVGPLASATSTVRITDVQPTIPGELVHASVALRKAVAASILGYSIGIEATWLDSAGAVIGTPALFQIKHEATTYSTYETLFEAPDGAAQFYISLAGGTSGHAYIVGAASVRRTLASTDDDGIQTVISPDGVTVSVLIPTDDGFERVTLTSMGRFYSAYDPETDQTSTMTGTEIATGVLAARDDVTIGGESVRDAIQASGGRVVMFDRATEDGALSANTIGYREFGFDAEGGQAYLLIIRVDVLISAAGQSFLYLYKTQSTTGGATPPEIGTTPEFTRKAFYATGGGEQVELIAAFVPSVSENTRWLVGGRSGGSRTIVFRDLWAYAIRLGDFTELPSSGRYTYGGATPTEPSPPTPPVDPTPPPQEYTHTDTFAWSRTYNNFGSDPNAWVPSGHVRQGVGGSSRYMALFGMSTASRNAAMAGTISKIEVFVYHDGPTPGGTLKISTHQQASMPAFSSGPSITLFNSYHDRYMARDSGSWITLPSSWYADFESGLRRGIAIGSTTGNWALMDIASHAHGTTGRRPKMRITYVA